MSSEAVHHGLHGRSSSFATAALVLCLGSAVAVFAAVNPLWATDTICRYAPMAEAFAAGEFAEAFHPRFGVAMPFLAGVCRLVFGIDGLAACAAVSAFAWALGALPLFWTARRVFGERTAVFAAMLYLACPSTLVWALEGMRESVKTLGVLLCVSSILECRGCRERGGWRACACACAGAVLLCTIKCDSVALGILAALAFAAVDGFGKRGIAVLAAAFAALQPMCALVYCWTGWWLPAPQYVTMVRKLIAGC